MKKKTPEKTINSEEREARELVRGRWGNARWGCYIKTEKKRNMGMKERVRTRWGESKRGGGVKVKIGI